MVKASNKARLDTIQSLGPIIIDFTPPVYGDGIDINVGNSIMVTWNGTSFYDDQDEAVLTEYQWALGMLI